MTEKREDTISGTGPKIPKLVVNRSQLTFNVCEEKTNKRDPFHLTRDRGLDSWWAR